MPLMRGPRQIDIAASLNSRLQSNPAWWSLFEAVSTVINDRITEPRRQLATIRDPKLYHRGDWVDLGDKTSAIINQVVVQEDGSAIVHAQRPNTFDGSGIQFSLPSNLKERRVLIDGAQWHGFNYFSDTLSDADYARINQYIEMYWPQSGTEQFVNFIGFLRGIRLGIDQLWSIENPDPAVDEYPSNPINQAPVHQYGKAAAITRRATFSCATTRF